MNHTGQTIINKITPMINELQNKTDIEKIYIQENCGHHNTEILLYIYLIHSSYKQKIGISKDYIKNNTYNKLCCDIRDIIIECVETIKYAENLKELSFKN